MPNGMPAEFDKSGKQYKAFMEGYVCPENKAWAAKEMSERYYRAVSPTTNLPFGKGFWFVGDATDWVRDTFGSNITSDPDKLIPHIKEFPVVAS